MIKMKNILIIIVITILNGIVLKSQNKFEIEASEGFVIFDYFGTEPLEYDKEFAGYGMQSEIDIKYKILNHKNINLKLGIGYSRFDYLAGYKYHFFAETNNINFSQFINFKLGTEYKPKWSKILFTLNSTHYIAVGQRFFAEYKWFTNLDIGLRIPIFKNFYLGLWTPISLKPIVDGSRTWKPIEFLKLNYDPWVEMTGLNLGISYIFGK